MFPRCLWPPVSCCSSAAAAGPPQDAHEPKGSFAVHVTKALASPRSSRSRVRPAWSCRCATPARRRCRTSPSRSTPSTTRATIPNWPPNKRPIWVVEHRPRRAPAPPGRERDESAPRRWPDGLREHLGARRARARAHRQFVWQVMPVKAGRYTVHYRSPPGSPAERARWPITDRSPTADPRSGTSPPRSPRDRRATRRPRNGRSCPAPTPRTP